jgi:hypothetical protein
MAFLEVPGGTTVTVGGGGASMEITEVGDRHRAFDGTYRSSVIDEQRTWRIRTTPLTRSGADTLFTTLTASTQPQSCAGDLLGSTDLNCDTQFVGEQAIVSSTGSRYVVEFILRESS